MKHVLTAVAVAITLVVFSSCKVESISHFDTAMEEVTGSASSDNMAMGLSPVLQRSGNFTEDFKRGFNAGFEAGMRDAEKLKLDIGITNNFETTTTEVNAGVTETKEAPVSSGPVCVDGI